MPARGAHLPLDEDPANRYLPWVVALMVYLAALALAGAFVLGASAARWQSGHGGRLTVQVPPANGGVTDERVAAVVAILRGTAGVAAARPLADDEIAALLEPWLGKGNIVSDLPLPRLVDAVLAPGARPDVRALELRLQAAAPGARVDDHGQWLDRLASAARVLQTVAVTVVAAIGLAAAGTVVFTTRTSLAVHQETIEVLHLIGAHDAFVARAFERQAWSLGLRGGLIGLGLAALTVVILRQLWGGLDAALLPRLSLSPMNLAALAVLPVASGLIAMVTARLTVLRVLARMP